MILWDILEVICIVYLEIFRFCFEALKYRGITQQLTIYAHLF